MKSVMISIHPKWCSLIGLGAKDIEIRKTKPKCESPFKCYIYCTSLKNIFSVETLGLAAATSGKILNWHTKVIGEFICDSIYEFEAEISKRANAYESITLRKQSEDYDEYGDYRYSLIAENGDKDNWLMHKSCVGWNELEKYLGNKSRDFYGWHISDLEIYDKPKELGEFTTIDNEAIKVCEHRERVYQNPDYVNGACLLGGYVCNKGEIDWCCDCKRKPLKRPPQSWCYVKELTK